MVTIQESRQQIEQARQQLEEQNRIAEDNKRKIEQAKKSLPDISSQKALRAGTFSGMSGKLQRQKVLDIKGDLITKEKLLQQSIGELSKYSSDVTQYEEGLNRYEQEVKAIQEQQSALDKVRLFANKGDLMLLVMYGNDLEKQYAKEWQLMQNDAKQEWINKVNSLQATLPSSEKLIIDYDKMKITGVSSGEFGSSLSLDAYNKKIGDLQKNAGSLNEKIKIDIPKLDVVEPPKTSIFSNEMFPMVSASMTGGAVREYNVLSSPNTNKDLFLTSGWSSNLQKRISERQTRDFRGQEKWFDPFLAIEQAGERWGILPVVQLADSSLLLGKKIGNLGFDSKTGRYSSDKLTDDANRLITGTKNLVNPSNLFLIGQGVKGAGGKIGETIRTDPFYSLGVVTALASPTLISKGASTLRAGQEARLFDKANTFVSGVRYEGGMGGIDLLQGVKVTKPNWFQSNVLRIKPTTYYSRVGQPFYFARDGARIVLEGGEGIAVSKAGSKVEAVGLRTGGRYNILETSPNVISKKWGFNIKRNLPEYQAGAGRVVIRQVGRIKGKYKQKFNLLTGKMEGTFKGKKYIESSKKGYNILGIGFEDEKGIIKVFGGETKKGRYYPIKDEYSLLGELKEAGFIKRIVPKKEEGIDIFQPANIKKTPLSKTFGQDILQEAKQTSKGSTGYTKGLIEVSMKPLIPTARATSGTESLLTGTTKLMFKESKTKIATTTKPEIREKNFIDSGTSYIETSKDRNLFGIKNVEIVKPKTRVKETTTQKPLSKVLEEFKVKQPQMVRLLEKVIQKNRQATKTPTKTTTKTPTKIKVPIVVIPILVYNKNGVKIEKEGENYYVYIRRFGEWILLSTTTSLERAIKLGKDSVESNLGASLKVLKGKDSVDVLGNLGSRFRPSKKEKNVSIQKSKFRLSSFGELKEINFFKKKSKNKKSKKNRWFD